MSKAFTREDDAGDLATSHPHESDPALPDGVPNYMTPDGAARVAGDLARMRAAATTAPHARSASSVYSLARRMAKAIIVPKPTGPQDVVRFGNTVSLRSDDGRILRYRIVGVDETGIAHALSWLTPLAKALIGSRVGDIVSVDTDDTTASELEFEVLAIE